MDTFKQAWQTFDEDTKNVLLAALWAGKDVHSPLDNLNEAQFNRLEELADFTNENMEGNDED
jgi:hypothetical protein